MVMETLKRGKKYGLHCGSTYCTCLACCLIRTLRRSVLEPILKPGHAATRVLCKVLASLRTIYDGISASFSYIINVFMSLRC